MPRELLPSALSVEMQVEPKKQVWEKLDQPVQMVCLSISAPHELEVVWIRKSEPFIRFPCKEQSTRAHDGTLDPVHASLGTQEGHKTGARSWGPGTLGKRLNTGNMSTLWG